MSISTENLTHLSRIGTEKITPPPREKNDGQIDGLTNGQMDI